jgi:hypothetical protein
MNWHKFLEQEDYTQEDFGEAVKAAESWTTCAVGECKVPRKKHTTIAGAPPQDRPLYMLGCQFCGLVQEMETDWWNNEDRFYVTKQKVVDCLFNIELRASVVLKNPQLTEHYEIPRP